MWLPVMVQISTDKWEMDLKMEEGLLMVIRGGVGSWGWQLRRGTRVGVGNLGRTAPLSEMCGFNGNCHGELYL